ncbi:TPA: hypothetical protein ACIAIE_005308 [Serratia fonticola]
MNGKIQKESFVKTSYFEDEDIVSPSVQKDYFPSWSRSGAPHLNSLANSIDGFKSREAQPGC